MELSRRDRQNARLGLLMHRVTFDLDSSLQLPSYPGLLPAPSCPPHGPDDEQAEGDTAVAPDERVPLSEWVQGARQAEVIKGEQAGS